MNDSPKFPSDLVHFLPDMNEIIIAGFVANNGTYIVSIDAQLNDLDKNKASISFKLQFISGKNVKPYYVNQGPLQNLNLSNQSKLA